MEKDKDDLETIDSCFNTENEHWNKFAFKVHCKAIEEGLFSDPVIPLFWIDKAIERFVKGYNTPDATVQEFIQELQAVNLSSSQNSFIFTWVEYYLQNSEFDQDLSSCKKLLSSHVQYQIQQNLPAKVSVRNTRDRLKELVDKELAELPENLKKLEPEKRLNILCKLIPFVMPKLEAVDWEHG